MLLRLLRVWMVNGGGVSDMVSYIDELVETLKKEGKPVDRKNAKNRNCKNRYISKGFGIKKKRGSKNE